MLDILFLKVVAVQSTLIGAEYRVFVVICHIVALCRHCLLPIKQEYSTIATGNINWVMKKVMRNNLNRPVVVEDME